jgi:hypothetical protein
VPDIATVDTIGRWSSARAEAAYLLPPKPERPTPRADTTTMRMKLVTIFRLSDSESPKVPDQYGTPLEAPFQHGRRQRLTVSQAPS